MPDQLPEFATDFMDWEWEQIAPHYARLKDYDLSASTIDDWLMDWRHLHSLIAERYARLIVAARANTADEEAEQAYKYYLENIHPRATQASQELNLKLLESGLVPDNFEIPLRNIKAETELFREDNLPLLAQQQQLALEYHKLIGAQTVEWEGAEVTTTGLVPLIQDAARDVRERAWRLASKRVLEDREAINHNWQKLLEVRRQIADNAGMDFREYMWRDKLRFDYTPADARTFHAAIEEVVVPATRRVYERRREALGFDTLRPWDVSVDVMRTTEVHGDPHNRPPLQPFSDITTLEDTVGAMFNKLDPELGEYFAAMRRENLLDLPNRKAKGPGAFCISYPTIHKPFVFANAVGMHGDVQTTLHEMGHAFHVFERTSLPYHHQWTTPMEFNEVASMAMELLGMPYFTTDQGGFYNEADANRAVVEHLESILIFWPYMAVVDSFQHWVYDDIDAAMDPVNCDAKWAELWDRFIQGVDWSGLPAEKETGWHRKQHIHAVPFYYIEYGLAQLGAVQVWRNALQDQAGAVKAYRRALALAGTVTLPELYETAGARFAFDADTLKGAVDLLEQQIDLRMTTA